MRGNRPVAHVLVAGGRRDVFVPLLRDDTGRHVSTIVAANVSSAVPPVSASHSVYTLSDSASTSDWLSLARQINEDLPVDGVAAFNENDQDKAAAIAKALDLPFHSQECVENVYDKLRMRTVLNAAGLDATPVRRVDSRGQLMRAVAELGYPLILKPRRGAASRGISAIRSSGDVGPALAWLAQTEEKFRASAIVERLREGREISVEGFSENGRHKIICFTEKFLDGTHFVERGHRLPLILAAPLSHRITSLVVATLDHLGIRNGPTHTEILLTADGPFIVETHLRCGGAQIPELIRDALGIDVFGLVARQCLGEEVLGDLQAYNPVRSRVDRYAAVRFMTPPERGEVVDVLGVEAARKSEGVREVTILKPPGTFNAGAAVRSSFDRAARCRAVGTDPASAVALADLALSNLRFIVRRTGDAR